MATVRGIPVTESIDYAVKSGCAGIEIQTDYLPEDQGERDAVFACAKQCGLHVSLHGPSSDINISSLNRGIRRESVRQIKEAIDIAARYGLEKVTMHPGLLSSTRENVEDKWVVMLDSMAELASYAREAEVHLGVENMEKRKKELVFTLADLNRFSTLAEGNPWFGVTLDFCHFATNGILAPELTELKLPVKNVHISQCIGGKPHFALDRAGEVSTENVARMLDAIGYTGSVTMEIKSVYDPMVYAQSRLTLEAAGF